MTTRRMQIHCWLCAIVLFWTGLALPAAAEQASLRLRSGNVVEGTLVDLSGSGFTIESNGDTRQIPVDRVAMIEFSDPSPDAQDRPQGNADRARVVLRSGQIVEGRLSDLRGNDPLRVIVETPNGQREFPVTQVARIYYANSKGTGETAGANNDREAKANDRVQPGEIRVDGSRPWTDSGFAVRRGQQLSVEARGEIMLRTEGSTVGVNGTTDMPTENFPLPSAPAGALIGRIGDGEPFAVGSRALITMPQTGRLMLGTNDDHHADNSGFFAVRIEPNN